MSDKFSKYLTGFRKNHNTQHVLLNMIENWKSNLNKGNKIGAIFMDLSKAFDTLDHSLLIAKLDFDSFIFRIHEKLPNKQKTDVRSETVLVYGEKLHQASSRFLIHSIQGSIIQRFAIMLTTIPSFLVKKHLIK